jgi:hypothetical protein
MNTPSRTCLALFLCAGRVDVRRVRVIHALTGGGVFAEPIDKPDRYHVLPAERVSDGAGISEKIAAFAASCAK